MADWEEIKRLAADFQRTQTSDTLQRISERNCIDIVRKLTDLNLIELIYTCDGKEFLTPAHLRKEIEDEVYVNGGRVHLHDVAATLNVDYQHVENMSKQIVADRPEEYNLILGQIIHSTYKSTLEKQIGDTMISTGQLSIADFAKTLDLPSEFLSSVVRELLPRIMSDYEVSQDGKTYYTADMMDRYRSIIAGTLTAITKPTTIASIMKKLDISERLFTPIVDGLLKEGRIDALVENRLFIPAVYAREQNEWIDKFYSSNSYIEYDVLLRKDIKQPKAFLRKRFPEGLQLKTCFVSPTLVSQVESLIEDCIATSGLIDISSILPPSIQPEDIEQLLQDIFKKQKQFGPSCLVLNQTNVCSLGYIATCKKSFSSIMEARAREQLQQGKLINHFLGGHMRKPTGESRNKQPVQQQASEQPKKPDAEDSNKAESKCEKSADTSGQQPENRPPEEQADGAKKTTTTTTTTNTTKGDDIELTAEDLKRERRQKKGAGGKKASAEQQADASDQSDEDQAGGKKGGKSKKSGGGAQGREIKQKATKKKYLAGSNKRGGGGGNRDDSDDEQAQAAAAAPPSTAKQSRSNKGRAARRGASPEPAQQAAGSTGGGARPTAGGKGGKEQAKEPLTFLAGDELLAKLRDQSRESGDFSDELFASMAELIESDLNKTYETVARKVLDDYLRSEAHRERAASGGDEHGEDGDDDDDDAEIDLVE